MSWELFKRNILKYSNNPEAITDINQVAKFYAREYDMAIKRGYDSVNFVTMQRGNVIIMEKLFKLALKSGGLATSPYNLVGNMGKGVIAYWTGGIMNQLPIPIMPAPGSISNVSVVSNTVINPGVWLSKLPTTLKPTNQTELIIDEFIKYAIKHLTTVSGIINTISLYPPASISGPGIIPWTGYFVPPSIPTPKLPDTTTEIDTSEMVMTPDDQNASEQHSLQGYNINESNAVGFSHYDSSGDINPNASKYGSLREDAENTYVSILDSNLPIDGIEEIPNYDSRMKIPPELVLAMRRYGICKTPIERAHFLSQVAHESMNFFYKEEIASGKDYEGRTTLGNIYPGDGIKYKGRGYIQLTGRFNYTKFGPMIGADLVNNPLLVSQKYYADVSCLFWKVNNIGSLATSSSIVNIKMVTRRINGGYNGIDDRTAKFKKYWIELQRNPNLWI